MKEPKVKWVKSWRDFPNPDKTSSQMGFSEAETGDVYAIKGVTSRAKVEHEKYHSIQGHPNKPYKAINHVDNEIKAYVYAFKQTGQPKHLLQVMKALFNDQTREYKTTPRTALLNIRKTFLKYEGRYPETWQEDYSKLVKEYIKVFGKNNKRNK